MFNLKNLKSMKKSFLMLGAAVAALTSCTQSEVLNVAQQPEKTIGFEPFVDKQTRTTDDISNADTDNNPFKEFYVFCAKGTGGTGNTVFTAESTPVLNHQKVTGGKGKWTYEPHASWVANKTFRFAAYANGNADGSDDNKARLSDENVTFVPDEAVYTKNENGDYTSTVDHYVWGLNITNYQVSDKDLIAAVPGQKVVGEITTAPASVGLTFKHILSKVIFQFFMTNSDQNLKMEIKEFSFSAYKQGDCQVRYTGVEGNDVIGATWVTKGSTTTYTFFDEYNWNSTPWTTGPIDDALYVIPQENGNITIDKITIETKKVSTGEVLSTKTFKNISLAIPKHTDWLPGYVYRYQANLTPDQHYIHFTTTVNNWIDEDERNQTITGGTTVEEN